MKQTPETKFVTQALQLQNPFALYFSVASMFNHLKLFCICYVYLFLVSTIGYH